MKETACKCTHPMGGPGLHTRRKIMSGNDTAPTAHIPYGLPCPAPEETYLSIHVYLAVAKSMHKTHQNTIPNMRPNEVYTTRMTNAEMVSPR